MKNYKKLLRQKFLDIDTLALDVLADCKTAACEILEDSVAQLNESIRKEKATRKELGLVLKEKNRKRSILTELGTLNLPRDYFFDKTCDRYVFVLDAMLGLQRYERISGNVRTRLVTEATDVSYAKSAQIVTGGSVSRQSVGNAIRKLTVLEKEPDWIEKKKVKELHVYADEDHVHLQKPKKEAGKKGKIVPLVSVTEGTESKMRNDLPDHFVDEHFDSKSTMEYRRRLHPESVCRRQHREDLCACRRRRLDPEWTEGFCTDRACTGWISPEKIFTTHQRAISQEKPARLFLQKPFEQNDRKKADQMLQELYAEAEGDKRQTKAVKEFEATSETTGKKSCEERGWTFREAAQKDRLAMCCRKGSVWDPMGWSEECPGKVKSGKSILEKWWDADKRRFQREG